MVDVHRYPARPDFVEVKRLDPSFCLDVRYATSKNFVSRKVYDEAAVFLQKDAAHALARAQSSLAPQGLGLLLFDGYRPWSVTKIFWDSLEGPRREFVANPEEGSVHNRGCAIDLSLCDLATGKELDMGSEFDETTPRSYTDYPGATPEQRERRQLLKSAMEAQGFRGIKLEWWHFNFGGWKTQAVYDLTFAELRSVL